MLYCDVLISEPLAPIVATHSGSGAIATLAVYESDRLHAKGVVSVDATGRVTGFVEHGAFPDDARGLVNAGLYVVDPSLIERIPAGAVADFGHDVFPDALARGEHLATHLLPEPVLDLGTPAALALGRAQAS